MRKTPCTQVFLLLRYVRCFRRGDETALTEHCMCVRLLQLNSKLLFATIVKCLLYTCTPEGPLQAVALRELTRCSNAGGLLSVFLSLLVYGFAFFPAAWRIFFLPYRCSFVLQRQKRGQCLARVLAIRDVLHTPRFTKAFRKLNMCVCPMFV